MVLSAGIVARIVSGPPIGRLADRLRGASKSWPSPPAFRACSVGSISSRSAFYPCSASPWRKRPRPPPSPRSPTPCGRGRRRRSRFSIRLGQGRRLGRIRARNPAVGPTDRSYSGSPASSSPAASFSSPWRSARRGSASARGRKAIGAGLRAPSASLWAIPAYRRLIFVAVLVLGSHAMNDTFAVISWRAAGYGSGAISLLWSGFGRRPRLPCSSCSAPGSWRASARRVARACRRRRRPSMGRHGRDDLDAGACWRAGAARPHLRIVAPRRDADHRDSVPERLTATAQTVYGALALGLASAALTFASGYLYEGFGMRAFWTMAALCACALPLVSGVQLPRPATTAPST